jgi:hypothetical protein
MNTNGRDFFLENRLPVLIREYSCSFVAEILSFEIYGCG